MSIARSIGAVLLLAALAASASAQPPAAPPAFDVKVTSVEAVHAIVLPMRGSYLQHPDAFGRLNGYLSSHGLKPAGPLFGRYFSDPSVGEENLVWEVGIPVAAGLTAEAPFEAKDFPAATYAVHIHTGPMEEIGAAWGSLVSWVVSNGHQPVLPAVQVFKGDMMAAPEVEMRIAVQK